MANNDRWFKREGDNIILRYYDRGQYLDVDMSRLVALKAEDKYITAYLSGGDFELLATSIVRLVGVLDPEVWVQVHRGVIVNRHKIYKVYKDHGRNIRVLLDGLNEPMPVSESYKHLVLKNLHLSAENRQTVEK